MSHFSSYSFESQGAFPSYSWKSQAQKVTALIENQSAKKGFWSRFIEK